MSLFLAGIDFNLAILAISIKFANNNIRKKRMQNVRIFGEDKLKSIGAHVKRLSSYNCRINTCSIEI